jgi:hypothetical protein
LDAGHAAFRFLACKSIVSINEPMGIFALSGILVPDPCCTALLAVGAAMLAVLRLKR